jgi:hypothetical protein
MRAEYAADDTSGGEVAGRSDEELLEHRTHLFLIDPLLDALGWSASDPTRGVHEARSRTRNVDRGRVYFD